MESNHLTLYKDIIAVFFEIPTNYTLSYVYWKVHHCDSWRIKDQLDVTCYFISLLVCSACFGY